MSRPRVYGQQPIEGAYRFELSLDEQASFSRVVAHRAERLALGPVPGDHVLRADPALLKPDLIDVREPGDSAASYENERGRRIFVALTPDEYKMIPHFPAALGRSAINTTLAARPEREDFEEDVVAASRAGVTTVEGYRDKSDAYLRNSLMPESEKLDAFIETIQHPGLRRKKGLISSMDLTWVEEHHVGGILKALRKQRQWTPDNARHARTAVEYRLYGDREARNRVANWAEMINLAREWNHHKINLFQFKISKANDYIAERKR